MSQPLNVENSLDLLLVLLYAPGQEKKECEPIDGITRLQKLIFLLNQGKGPSSLVKIAKEYSFEAYKMGPYTDSLREDLDTLISLGLVGTKRLNYMISDDRDDLDYDIDDPDYKQGEKRKRIESQRFYLTENGKVAGSELWHNLTSKDRDALKEFKTFFCTLTLRQLLIFVYDQFPKFTVKSEIKKQLGL
ncbi:MAG: hypothetical protein CVV39_02915 [Planctomycetes bacterium HGW-Planctomycetes-1]|nr:MAG: hypothetical protein CVV39_02915 [Planctomycetes bacterium HGW-Planctomycetes-1]